MAVGIDHLVAQQHALYRNHNTWKTLSGINIVPPLDKAVQQGFRIRLQLLPAQVNDPALIERLQHCENGLILKEQLYDAAADGLEIVKELIDGHFIEALRKGDSLRSKSLYAVYRLDMQQQDNRVVIELVPTSTGRKPRLGDLLIC